MCTIKKLKPITRVKYELGCFRPCLLALCSEITGWCGHCNVWSLNCVVTVWCGDISWATCVGHRAKAAVKPHEATWMTRAKTPPDLIFKFILSFNAQKHFIVVKLFKPHIWLCNPILGHSQQLKKDGQGMGWGNNPELIKFFEI